MTKGISVLMAVGATVLNAMAQDQKITVPMENNKVVYSETVMNDSNHKSELYRKSKLCFDKNFKASRNTIQQEDYDSGIILGKGMITEYEKIGWSGMIMTKTWKFTLRIGIKEGQYKVEIYDIEYVFALSGEINNPVPNSIILNEYYNNPTGLYNKDGKLLPNAEKLTKETNETFKNLIAEIKNTIQNGG